MFGRSMRRALVAVVAAGVLGGSLSACTSGDDKDAKGKGDGKTTVSASSGGSTGGSSGGSGNGKPSGKVEAGVVKGHVSDPLGNPVKGAEVVVDNQLLYDSNIVLVTDDRGDYRAEMPTFAATYAVTATMGKTYNGAKYTFDLAPSDPSPFVGKEGAVRDFTWQLTGPRPEGDFFYGGILDVYVNPSNPRDGSYVDQTDVRFVLTPVGTLVDGSTGKTVTKTPETGQFEIPDIPVGRYKITAVYAPKGKAPVPMKVGLRGSGQLASEVTGDFKQEVAHQILKVDAGF